ncbi:MAG: M23 family metallopeptidase [Candidatus Marinimicrobia bacterium]|nr:M23 family metallopeptidase [Candidatus Neomarinimicrobiota bacterium]
MPQKNHKFIFQAESDRRVRQWHFSLERLLGRIGVIAVIVAAALYFSADWLTGILYNTKLTEMQKNYSDLSSTVVSLHNRVETLNSQMSLIEEKDKAVRTYADLPEIDESVRKLGIGGVMVNENVKIDNLLPDFTSTITSLELDIDALTRKVKLELSSYEDIYDKVQENSDRIKSVPTIRPVNGGYLNAGFGYRIDPFDRVNRFHYGQDITVNNGTPIYAPADGVVKIARYMGGFGKSLKIDHGFGYTTFFAHLSKFNIDSGKRIKRGDIIGYSGNTGRSTGSHLHYEVHYYGKPQNPLDYFFSGYMN